ncbi:hypothetical protein B7494_g3284 [Chlorociboria aeruginascens]|nr:hypothetical protein B7494_g3284 [Chlorociboria aeruginascens]
MRLSGLQKEVLALYRKCLRESRKKPPNARAHFESFTRTEFQKHVTLDKKDFSAIEFLLRKGQRQVAIRIAHTAAINVLRVPLGSTLDQARKKQRLKLRRRRIRSSGTYSVLQARRRVSQRARQNIEVFGWATPLAELSRKGSYLTTDLKPRITKDTSKPRLRYSSTQRSFVASTDGAGNAVAKKFASIKSRSIPKKTVYSLMQVSEAPAYWGSMKPVDVNKSMSTRSADAEYAHVGSLGTVSKGATNSGNQRSGTYDPRVTPEKPVCQPSTSKTPTNSRRSNGSQKQGSQAWGNPRFWEAIDPNILPLGDPGSSSIDSTVRTSLSEAPSRTRSQRRALRRFTKELELYIQALGSMPKQSVVASPPSSIDDSTHTIQELKPYKEEFQSAGLAITSADQRREFRKPPADLPPPPPTPPKDEKWKKSQSSDLRKKPAKNVEPHSLGNSTSSDGTIIVFTPPHEKTQTKPVSSKTPTKKSLPWLQKTESFPGFNPTVAKKSATSDFPEKSNPPNPPQNPLSPSMEQRKDIEDTLREVRCTTDIRWNCVRYSLETTNESNDRSENTEERMQTEIDTTDRETAQIGDEDLDSRGISSCRNKTFPPISVKCTGDWETSQQAQKLLSRSLINRYSTQREVDQATQTEDIKNSDNDQIGIVRQERAPITSGRNKTFPPPSTKCVGNCEASRETKDPFNELASNERNARREVDQGTQTEDIRSSDNSQFERIQEKQSPLHPIVKTDDGSLTFSSTPKRNDKATTFGPFRASAAALSSRQSFDDKYNTIATKSPSHTHSKVKKDESPRSIPSQPSCVQCGAEIQNHPVSVGEVEPKPVVPQSELELNQFTEPVPGAGLLYACTIISSLQCQKCASSKSSKASPRNSALRTRATSRRLTNKALPNIPIERGCGRVPAGMIAGYSTKPVPDPVKQSAKPNTRQIRTAAEDSHRLRHAKYIYLPTPPTPPLPLVPVLLDTVHCHDVVPSNLPILTCAHQGKTNITDKDVSQGLHVATAAAYDEDVDKWVEEVTGYGVRRLLADLSVFDGLGINSLAGVAKKTAMKRKVELKAWEKLREEGCCVDKCDERAEEAHAGDDSKDNKAVRESEKVINGMVKMKMDKEAKGMRDRAVKMGWMSRSLSSGA